MFEVRVEADFAAAHYLRDYHGKCERLHGHNYRVLAHAKGEKLDEGGMLLDFAILKQTLKKVCAELDHSNLNDNEYFQQNPSAERIAKYIYDRICEELPQSPLYAVDVYETATSRARYIKEKKEPLNNDSL